MKTIYKQLSILSVTILSASVNAQITKFESNNNCQQYKENEECQFSGNVPSIINESNNQGNIVVYSNDAYFSDRAGFSTEGKNNNIDMTVTNSTFGANVPTQGSLNLSASEGSVSLEADDITTSSSVQINGNAGNSVYIKNSALGSDGTRSLYVYQQSNSNAKMGSSYIDVSNSSLSDTLWLQTRGDTSLIISNNSTLNGVRNINSGLDSDTQAQFSDSIEHGNINIQATYGNATVSLDNMSMDLPETGDQSQLQVTSGNVTQVDVLDSSISGGIYIASHPRDEEDPGTSILNIENSTIGQYGASSAAIKVIADGENSTSANVDIQSSQIAGDIVAESEAAEQNASITLDNTHVSGDIKLRADDMTLNIDNDATFSGQLDVSDYYTDTEELGTATKTTVNVSNANMSNNITNSRGDDGVNNSLTINVNQGAIIGGNDVSTAMQLTGFSDVNVNVNYVDPSLINTGVDKYFYVDNTNTVQVNGVIDDHGTLATIRNGAYIYNKVQYHVDDDSDQQDEELSGNTYAVSFTTDVAPQTASDIQAAQAGLLASDDMLHRVVSGISRQLDMITMAANNKSRLWTQALYGSDDRNAGDTEYSNNISGGQIGIDVPLEMKNGDVLSIGLAYAHAYNNLKLQNESGYNHINGDYYSTYLRWNTKNKPESSIGWFVDSDFTWANMRYDASESEGDLSGGGNYQGSGFLWQTRIGALVSSIKSDIWLQPYFSLGYSEVNTDNFNDGYTDINDGKTNGFYSGIGTRLGTSFSTSAGITIKPYVDASYTTQIDNDVDFSAGSYNYDGQNLHLAQLGLGSSVQISPSISANVSLNTLIGQSIEHDTNGDVSIKYSF